MNANKFSTVLCQTSKFSEKHNILCNADVNYDFVFFFMLKNHIGRIAQRISSCCAKKCGEMTNFYGSFSN